MGTVSFSTEIKHECNKTLLYLFTTNNLISVYYVKTKVIVKLRCSCSKGSLDIKGAYSDKTMHINCAV